MVFLKSCLAGLAALAGYVVLLCLALWYGPILWLQWQMWRASGESGAGSAGFFFAASPLLLIPGFLAFGAAFWWEWTRASSRAQARL
jgi:hypothetical protein